MPGAARCHASSHPPLYLSRGLLKREGALRAGQARGERGKAGKPQSSEGGHEAGEPTGAAQSSSRVAQEAGGASELEEQEAA